MPDGLIKLGLAGCGWIAENGHIPAFKKIGDVELKSVFDIDINRATEIASRFEIKDSFDNYDEFLQSGIDAVVITTPNFTHSEYALAALEKGKHILCEKPFTINSYEATKITDAAKKNKKVAMPAFVNRFRYDVTTMNNIIKQEIGQIKDVQASWNRKSGVPRPRTWFTSKKHSGGGVLIDLGSHIVDLCLMIKGVKPVKTMSLHTTYNIINNSMSSASWFNANYNCNMPIDVEDSAVADIEFIDNTKIHINLSWQSQVVADSTFFRVIGSKGMVELKTLFGFSNQKLWKDEILTIHTGCKTESISLKRDGNKTLDAFYEMAKQFVEQIKNGGKSDFLTVIDGYNTVNIIDSLYNNETKCQSYYPTISLGSENNG